MQLCNAHRIGVTNKLDGHMTPFKDCFVILLALTTSKSVADAFWGLRFQTNGIFVIFHFGIKLDEASASSCLMLAMELFQAFRSSHR